MAKGRISVELIGIDPSYRNLAYSIMMNRKRIRIFCLSEKLGDRVDFTKSFYVANILTDKLISKMDKIKSCDTIITEIPAPNMQYTMGLSILDTLVVYKLIKKLNPKKVFTLSPSFLSHLHGTNKYSKKDSETLARHFIEVLIEKGFDIRWDGKLNADMSEAFLFMLKGAVITNHPIKSLILDELNAFYGDNYKIIINSEVNNE